MRIMIEYIKGKLAELSPMEAVVEATAVFGGIDILVPEKCVVKIKSNSAFGGIKKTHKDSDDEKAPVIYVNGSAVFGGIEIK